MKISVIVPTYNRANLIGRAIKSVLAQSFNDWELIIVDDGSTDNTDQVVSQFITDNRIIYLKLPNNKGVNFARNSGIEKATGVWIALLDSDDEYLPNGLDKIHSVILNVRQDIDVVGFITLRKTNNDIARGGYNSDDSKWNEFYPTYEDIILKRGGKGDTHFCIRRKIFLENYSFPEWICGLESFFFAQLAKNNKKFVYINQDVVMVHTDSTGRLSIESYLARPKQYVYGYKQFIKEHYNIFKKHPNVLLKYYQRIAKCYIKLKNPLAIWWIFKMTYIKIRLALNFFNSFVPR